MDGVGFVFGVGLTVRVCLPYSWAWGWVYFRVCLPYSWVWAWGWVCLWVGSGVGLGVGSCLVCVYLIAGWLVGGFLVVCVSGMPWAEAW